MAESATPKLDDVDRQILQILQSDASLTNAQLSELISLSPTPCLRRVKRLEAEGVIEGYRAVVNRERLGYSIMAFAQITLNQQIDSALEVVEAAVQQRPEIISCYLTTGENDYLLQVVVQSLDHYADLIRNHLTKIPAIQGIKSSFVLQQIVTNRPIDV